MAWMLFLEVEEWLKQLQVSDSFVVSFQIPSQFLCLFPNIFQVGQKHCESCKEMFMDQIKADPSPGPAYEYVQ